MRILLRFACELIRLLVQWFLQATLLLLGCAVRLLYWSVRTYGWGRVAGFGGALASSLWLHDRLHMLSLRAESWASVLITALAFWGIGIWTPRLLARWRRRGRPQRPAVEIRAAPEQPAHRVIEASPAFPPTEASSLWERILHPTNLQEAWQRVRIRGGSPGVDGISVEAFAWAADRHLQELAQELRLGRYRPRPVRWVEVPKPNGGVRRLAVLCVRDRIVHQALYRALAPLWDPRFAPCSFGYRPGRSALQAVEAVERALANGRVWVVDGDIEAFFDHIPHRSLWERLPEWIPDPQVRALVRLCVEASAPEPGRGIAQGSPLSPLLANMYLHPFDTALSEAGHQVVRYADDFVVLCATRPQAEEALRMADRLLRGLGLRLKAEKTRIVHRDEGFTFLGYLFDRAGKRPSEEALARLWARLETIADEEERRQVLAGWRGYFRDASGPESVEPQGSAGEGSPSEEALRLYRERFLGRPDVFARFWRRGGRHGYAPVRRPITDAELRAHLRGEEVWGTYPLHPDGTTRVLVLDIDGPDPSEDGQRQAWPLTYRMSEALRAMGVPVLLEDSGGKGYHLWVCFRAPVPARTLRAWAQAWLDSFRPFPEGVRGEIFPKQDALKGNALGALLRLPLGSHPQTGRPSRLLTATGDVVSDPWGLLASTPQVDPRVLAQQTAPQEAPIPEPPATVAPMIQGCRLLGELVHKAARTRHLHHTERLALLYTLGHCGEAGRVYLHQVIALCSNYDPRITERWIRRLDEGHRPLRCATLKKWLKDFLPDVACPCIPEAQDPTPLDWLRRPGVPRVEPAEVGEDLWSVIEAELFGKAP